MSDDNSSGEWQTWRVADRPVLRAPDGSEIRELPSMTRGSLRALQTPCGRGHHPGPPSDDRGDLVRPSRAWQRLARSRRRDRVGRARHGTHDPARAHGSSSVLTPRRIWK